MLASGGKCRRGVARRGDARGRAQRRGAGDGWEQVGHRRPARRRWARESGGGGRRGPILDAAGGEG